MRDNDYPPESIPDSRDLETPVHDEADFFDQSSIHYQEPSEEQIPSVPSGQLYVLSGVGRRLIALLLDLATLGIVAFILSYFIPALAGDSVWIELIFVNSLCLGLVGSLYFILMTKLSGQTLGKMIMGIRVVRLDGIALSWSTIIWRELIGRTISMLLGCYLGYAVALFTRHKQAPHDLLADTCVVSDRLGHSRAEIIIPA